MLKCNFWKLIMNETVSVSSLQLHYRTKINFSSRPSSSVLLCKSAGLRDSCNVYDSSRGLLTMATSKSSSLHQKYDYHFGSRVKNASLSAQLKERQKFIKECSQLLIDMDKVILEYAEMKVKLIIQTQDKELVIPRLLEKSQEILKVGRECEAQLETSLSRELNLCLSHLEWNINWTKEKHEVLKHEQNDTLQSLSEYEPVLEQCLFLKVYLKNQEENSGGDREEWRHKWIKDVKRVKNALQLSTELLSRVMKYQDFLVESLTNTNSDIENDICKLICRDRDKKLLATNHYIAIY